MCCMYTVYSGMQEWVIQIPSIPILVSVLFPSLHLKYFRIKFLLLVICIYALSSERVSILSHAKRYTKHSGCNSFNLSLHVLSFLLASLDSLLRDTTHWLPANTHSSGYDNHFYPSFRRSTPRKGIKERAKLRRSTLHA